MDSTEFREFGRAAIDFIADYLENIRDRDCLPSVEPGYLEHLIPNEAPQKSEDWRTVMEDMNRVIMPGVTHWQSPYFNAYFPSQTSFPAIVGEMLSAGISVIGFSWMSSPVCTELEAIVMDWLGKILGLPEFFLHSHSGPGGGVIQGSASEAIVLTVLSAREETVKRYQKLHPEIPEGEIRSKLIAYSSNHSNSAIEKSGLIAAIPVRLLESDENCVLTGDILKVAVEEDLKNGLIPVICIATLGTTGTCAFDKIDELGEVCNKNNIWLHIDAAYAAGAFCLPEYRYIMNGIERADSFNFNLHKWMLVNFDCSALWLKNANHVVDSFNVDRIYLKHQYQGKTKIPDYRHWQIALGRRFRALKVWITLRTFGVEKIQEYIRKHISLASKFADFVRNDSRFEIPVEPRLGLVCFRLKGDCELSKTLLKNLTDNKKVYMIPATVRDKYVIRYVICGMDVQERDVEFVWNLILAETRNILGENIENTKSTTSTENELTSDVQIDKLNASFTSDINISLNTEKVK